MSSRPPTPPGRPPTPTKQTMKPPPSPSLQDTSATLPPITTTTTSSLQPSKNITETKPSQSSPNIRNIPHTPSPQASQIKELSSKDSSKDSKGESESSLSDMKSTPAATTAPATSEIPPSIAVSPSTDKNIVQCDTCGIPIQRRRMFGYKIYNLTNENVHQGTCIRCYGELVPQNVFLEWYLRKRAPKNLNTSLAINTAAAPTTSPKAPPELTTISNPGLPTTSQPMPGGSTYPTPSPSSATTPGGWSFGNPSESTRVYEQGFDSKRRTSGSKSSPKGSKTTKFSFAGIANAESPAEQKALQLKYDKVFALLQSCRTDLNRPTAEELDRLQLTEEEWRSVVLISNVEVGCRLLHWAIVFKAPVGAIRFLLQRDVESSWTVQHADNLQRLPLHYACRYGAPIEVFELLLREDQGDDKKTIAHADSQGWMPLHVACQYNCSSNIIKLLLDQDQEKRSVSHRDAQNYLPIHLALERNVSIKTLELLLTADTQRKTIHARGPSGFSTIVEFAMKYDYESLFAEHFIKLLNLVVDEMNIHTACRFGVPLDTIKLLLDMDSNQSIYKIDEDENLPLHCALDGTASLEVIRHLIRMDTAKSTLAQKNKDGSTPLLKIALREDAMGILSGFPSLIQDAEAISIAEEMNLGVKMKVDVSLELQMKHTRLVNTFWLRRDFENRPSIAELTSLGYSEEFWRRVVLIEDEDTGWLPLHWALAFGAPPSTIHFLLEKDFEMHCIRHGNLSGSLPIHFACLRGVPYDVIQVLLDKDVTKTTIHQKNNAGRLPLDLLPKHSTVIASLVKDARTMDMQPEMLDFFFQSSPPSLFKRAIMDTLEYSSDSKSSLEWINYGFCQDSAIAFIMLEFYLLIAWIATFVCASFWYMTEGYLPEILGILLPILTVMVLAIKFRCAYNSEDFDFYFSGLRNLWSFCAIVLVFASAIALNSATPKRDWRPLIIATGTFQFGTLLISLERSFYSLALILGGIYRSFWKLIPFFIVTTLGILAFAFLFFINRYDSTMDIHLEHQTLTSSLNFVFSTFVGRPEEAINWLDVVFSILAVLVLLNVAIAIVTQNWQSTTSQASKHFWVDRLYAIVEYRSRGSPSPNPANSLWERLTEKMSKDISQELLFHKVRYLFLYLGFFLAGLPTLGWLWPQEIRRHIFYAPPKNGSDPGASDEAGLVVLLERKINLLEENIEWHQRLLDRKIDEGFDDLKSLIASLQGSGSNKESKHKKRPSSGNDLARVDGSGKAKPFPPIEILVAKA